MSWYNGFNRVTMTVTVSTCDSDITLPVVMKVCDNCNGHGSHVRRSIDAHGITDREFAEDPDFREAYFSGAYDVVCSECSGNNVVPEVDESLVKTDKYREGYQDFLDYQEEKRMLLAEERAEARYFGYM